VLRTTSRESLERAMASDEFGYPVKHATRWLSPQPPGAGVR
jgi:hypothetical protein